MRQRLPGSVVLILSTDFFIIIYFFVFGSGAFYALRLMSRTPEDRISIDEIGPTRTAGITPIAQSLARLASGAGFHVSVFDPAAESSRFATANVVSRETALDAVEPAESPFVVVATQGQWDELSRLADRGELRKNLRAQVERLQSDPRSRELVDNFVGQWLQVRDVDGIDINAQVVLMAKGVDGDAGQAVQILVALIVPDPASLAVRESNRNPVVGGHQVRRDRVRHTTFQDEMRAMRRE